MRRPPAATVRRQVFRLGALLVVAGVALHVPDYVSAAPDHFMMAGMAMGTTMSVGMTLIVVGLVLGVWGLLPGRAGLAARRAPAVRFAALDAGPLTRAHRILIGVLTIGLVVDTMKPASLGFVSPGMAAEYGLSTRQVALLPFVAIAGTVLGSVVWGHLADVVGRRATIVISALMYVATCVCGFMPSFGWNLVMCFAMGAAAGGMLPTVYSLMSESVPARHRGWLLVLQSGLGATLGYLVASGAATLLVPDLGWRALWLLNAPTGLLLTALARWIPESPRYLTARGRHAEAAVVMARYGVRAVPDTDPPVDPPLAPLTAPNIPATPVVAMVAPRHAAGGIRALVAAGYRGRTGGIVLYGLGWGVVNWGFVTFLPVFLAAAGAGTRADRLLFLSSLLALPATGLAAALYARWSSRRAMLAYSAGTVLVLVLFAVLRPERPGAGTLLVVLVGVLLAGLGGMIAMLSPYAAEVYPTALRATGSGVAAAASKVGGLLGPALLTSAVALGPLALVCAVPVAAAALVLWRTGLETAGRPLVETTVGGEHPVPAAEGNA